MTTSAKNLRPLTRRQLADEMGVSLRTVARWMNARLIPFVKIGGSVRFDREDVAQALRKLRVPTHLETMKAGGAS
jgi:excisionase family DNA binding protein